MNETIRCIRARVTGRVQGVGYRMATRSRAHQLGLLGHAANCLNGQVEVLAYGSADAVNSLIEWLAEGPPAASVEDVYIEEVDEPFEGTDRFEIR